ncbi:MAG: hypothetical protein MJZ20_08080 [Bacteroidaceae bacterium]|nr:hypothetical protein [Bacteroidaceae bacterium]
MFITYKITNVITGKYYIGSHKTDDPYDDYMGSGKWIRDSIQKYGVENHKKEILGIFETRKESIDLEHRLIVEKRKSEREALLNANTGGFSFDYINENLSFDRAAFAKKASHDYAHNKRLSNIAEYEKHPAKCLCCGAALPYNLKNNKFCSASCSATFNNKNRHKQKSLDNNTSFCLNCGKPIPTKNKKFCSIDCSSVYAKTNATPVDTELKIALRSKRDEIVEKHKTMSCRELAKEYNTSANTISKLLRGLL